MLDVLIQTFNEEANLPHTLTSLGGGWVNRVFVVDSGSTDRTREITKEHGATLVEHAWEGYARQKNWALENLPFESPWILIVDADEAVSDELRKELIALTCRPTDEVPHAGFMINRVFIFMGRRIWHSGYFPSWNLRLFKRGMARYEERLVHEHMICDGSVGRLKHLLIHEDRRGMEHFFAKHNRYSTLEAEEIYFRPDPWPGFGILLKDGIVRRRFVKSRVLPVLPAAWLWRWVYMYICRLGILDGRAGWWLSHFIANYELGVQIKLRQLRRFNGAGVRSAIGLADVEGHLAAIAPAPAPMALARTVESSKEAARSQPASTTAPGPRARPVRNFEAAPTLVERRGSLFPATGDRVVFVSPWTFRQNVGRALWMVVSKLLFRFSFHNWYGWRRLLLRLFGAKIGRDVRVRPSAHIEIPWNLDLRDGAVVGDYAILYSLGRITVGKRSVISQYAHLCAGTHDHRFRDFPLLRPEIRIGDEVWIAADAFVGPGVKVGDRAVVGARASAFKNIPDDMIAAGNPAHVIKPRVMLDPLEPVPSAGGTSAPPSVAAAEPDHHDDNDGAVDQADMGTKEYSDDAEINADADADTAPMSARLGS